MGKFNKRKTQRRIRRGGGEEEEKKARLEKLDSDKIIHNDYYEELMKYADEFGSDRNKIWPLPDEMKTGEKAAYNEMKQKIQKYKEAAQEFAQQVKTLKETSTIGEIEISNVEEKEKEVSTKADTAVKAIGELKKILLSRSYNLDYTKYTNPQSGGKSRKNKKNLRRRRTQKVQKRKTQKSKKSRR